MRRWLGGLEASFIFQRRLKTKTDKNWTKDKLTVSVCFSYGSICCCDCGDSFLKKAHEHFLRTGGGVQQKGSCLFQGSGVIYSIVICVYSQAIKDF